MTSDNHTRFNLFRDGQIAFVRLGGETVREALDRGMRVKTFRSGGLAYVWFNHREGRATRNLSLRKAIQASFDPDEYVNQVIAIPGYRATRTLFPGYFRGVEKSFTEEYPVVPIQVDGASELARAEAALGELPRLSLLTVSSTTGLRAAEYIQGKLKRTLGLDILVDQQSFKQYLNKARQGAFDLVLSSWYPDFDDIVTYADLLGSFNPNNRGRYVNDEYDRWLQVLIESTDPGTRFGAAAELQRIIIQEAPLLPAAETGSAYLLHPGLRGVARRVFGQDPDFSYARVVP